MKINPFALLAAFLPLATTQPASAATSRWEKVEGGAVRIVLSSKPDERGRMRGALQIELKPGWKTYWRDPGGAGVPPSVAAIVEGKPAEVEISFPPPARHDDGYAVWAGYNHPVSLAMTVAHQAPHEGPVEFSVFIGVCETICIPVQARFSVKPDRNMADAGHEAIVEGAFAALPGEPREGMRVTAARIDGENVIVEAEAPVDPAMELFLASTENRMLGTPALTPQDGRIAFRVPILSGSSDAAEKARYTLISGGEAVSGMVTIER